MTRAFTVLFTGSVWSQVLAFAFGVLVARVYAPAEYGSFATIAAVAAFLTPLATLGLEAAIAPADSETDAWSLVRTSLAWCVAMTCITATAVCAYRWLAPDWSPLSGNNVVFALPGLLAVYGLLKVLTQVSLRQREYFGLSARGVVQQGATGVAQLAAAAIAGASSLALASGEVLGRGLGAALLFPSCRRLRESAGGGLLGLKEIWRLYGGTVKHYLPGGLLEQASVTGLLLMTAHWYGEYGAGQLGLVNRLLSAPVLLIGTALGSALVAEATTTLRSRSGDSTGVLGQTARFLTAASISLGFVLFGLGPWAVQVALGTDWLGAADLVRWLAFPTAVSLAWLPLASIFTISRAWGNYLAIAISRFLVTISVGFSLSHMDVEFVPFVALTASAGAVVQLIGIVVIALRVRAQAKGG